MKIPYTEKFEQFWEHYPRKVSKIDAFKAWEKQIDEDDAFMATAAIDDLKKRTRLKWWPVDTTKIPHGSSWINKRRWEDEGWEDDIKTFGKEQQPVHTPRSTVQEQADFGLDRWQMMLNRLALSYLRLYGGMTDEQVAKLVEIKNTVHKEFITAVTEEIDGADNKGDAKREMAYLFADTLCRRLDTEFDRHYRDRIYNQQRKKAA